MPTTTLRRLLPFAVVVAACGGDAATTTTVPPTVTTTTYVATTTVPTTTLPPLPGAGMQACLISDFGGIDDQALNQAAWAGLERAETGLGVAPSFLRSNDTVNYRRNLDAFLAQGCDLIVTTGALMAPDTAAVARENPDQWYAIIDYPVGAFAPWGDPEPGNVRGLTFQVDEAAFLAGYLAAGMSQSHVIGTFGGLDIPPITLYMEGYRRGALHYDSIHGTETTVLGWNGAEGLFTRDFTSTEKGYTLAVDLILGGADVILPVADRAGEGSCRAVEEANAAGASVSMIGKDWDWYLSAPDCAPVMLTSILKRIDVAVFKTIENLVVIDGLGNQYLGTLENGGVGLAPYHDLADRVPAGLAAEVEELAADIAAGRVSIRPPAGG